MDYSFDKYISRENKDCVKYDRREAVFGTSDLIPMWIADTDFEVPEFIASALKSRTDYPVYGYSYRSKRFYNAVQLWLKKRHNWDIDSSWIGFSPGVVTGVAFALRALTKQGDGVLIQTPIYPPFFSVISHNERVQVLNELKLVNGHFEIDFDDFEQKIKKVKAFILCNPHNPTGRAFCYDELKKMGEICVKHNVFIISDEIHFDLVHKPFKHTNIASISNEIANNTITVFASNKTFNTGSLITSVTIIKNSELRNKLTSEMQKLHIDRGNDFGTEAIIAAYNGDDKWVDSLKDYIAINIKYVKLFLEQNTPKIKLYSPEATFLLWLDFRELELTQQELLDFLVKEAKIGLGNGIDFGEAGNGFMRMNIGTRLDVVKKAMQQLHSAYKNRFE